MNNNSYFITAFGTFGNPNGFRQSYWFTKDKIIVNSIKTFDLNTNAIKLFPRSKVYAIRKEFAGDYNIISYSVYTYAKEQNSERSGTFIGSGILFTNKISEEYLVVNQLNEFHESLVEKNIENDAIIVSHSDKLSITKPRDFDKIGFQLKPVEDLNFIPASNKYLVVFCDISAEKLRLYFKKAPDLLNVYDTIYFTDSREVAEFVNQKGIFKLIQNVGEKRDFELEIQNLHEERTRKRESSISEFEREIQKLEDDKIRTLGDFNEQIAHNEKLHQANEIILRQSRSDLEKVEQIYSDFSSKIKEQANQLRSGRRLDEVKNIYNENKRRFFDAVTQFKKPDFINKISKAAAKPGFRPEIRFRQEEGELSSNLRTP